MGDVEKRADDDFLSFDRINRDYDELREGPGAYVLLTTGRPTWAYPWGVSPVFYIGKAKDLRDRLWDHWDGARHAKRSDGDDLYYAVNHYAAAFPTRYITVPTWQRMTPDALEEELFGGFVRGYGARPVANNQTRWNRT
jgi:hypothetical protein